MIVADVLQTQTYFVWPNIPVICLLLVAASEEHFRFVPIFDGGRISHARPNREKFILLLRVIIDFFYNFRARPDDAHISLENVDQLGKFVQFAAA